MVDGNYANDSGIRVNLAAFATSKFGHYRDPTRLQNESNNVLLSVAGCPAQGSPSLLNLLPADEIMELEGSNCVCLDLEAIIKSWDWDGGIN